MASPKMAGRAAEILTMKAAQERSAARAGEEVLQKEEKKSSKERSTEKTSKISKKVYPNERSFKDSKIEKSVLYDDDGSVLLEKTGSERQVRFSRQELEKFRGKVFTHSHPQDVTLSPADLMRMQEYEIKQVRAVHKQGRVCGRVYG